MTLQFFSLPLFQFCAQIFVKFYPNSLGDIYVFPLESNKLAQVPETAPPQVGIVTDRHEIIQFLSILQVMKFYTQWVLQW
jgi:hypothetical protein